MDTLIPQERLEIYKAMLEKLIADRERSLGINETLFGLCSILSRVNYKYTINSFPELMAIKPKKNNGGYWWSVDPKYTTRIDKLREIIERMEKEQTKTN